MKDRTVLWWVGWILLTILTFFVSCAFWTPLIARHFGAMDKAMAPIVWVTAVFGSWMVLLVPLIVVMYNKVDRVYEETRIRREAAQRQKVLSSLPFKSVLVPESERLLGPALVDKIKKIPPTLKRGHLVSVFLKNGRQVDHVFIVDKNEVMGVYGHDKPPFRVADIVDVRAADLERLPPFETERWLRFDGVGESPGA